MLKQFVCSIHFPFDTLYDIKLPFPGIPNRIVPFAVLLYLHVLQIRKCNIKGTTVEISVVLACLGIWCIITFSAILRQ